MPRDAQGHVLTGGTTAAASDLDRGIRALTLSYGDAMGAFDAAREAAPDFAMAHIAKAWGLALANDPILAAKAKPLIKAVRALPLNEREQAHLAALTHAVEGERAAGVAILDRHLMRCPHDLLAHFGALFMDAFLGCFPCVADRSARALPRWSKEQEGYGIMLSFYGFGLEEAADYGRAEDTSRQAADLEPHGYWPHHAVSHVLEMTGRPRDGLAWMSQREALWNGKDNTSRVHIWWHKALYHMELGDDAAALAIYDGPILEMQRPFGVTLTHAPSLLWRLETLGCDAGARWQSLADLWEGHADGRLCVFADIHAAMTAIRAGRTQSVERLLAAMRKTAGDGRQQSSQYRDIGLPTVRGLMAYADKDYAGAVEHLLGARYDLWRMGGSKAQRDVIDWTLTEAAARAGLRDVAVSLAHERLGLRPDSLPNKRFLERAEALATA